MNKIINGKRYSTEAAKCVGSIDYGMPGDFSYYCERLFRKRTGEFFLHGEGGPKSQYGRATSDNSWSGGEEITPISYEEAQEWAERNLAGDEYEEIFGVPEEEDEGKRNVTIRLSPAAYSRLKKEATIRGIPMSDYAEQLILK